MGQKPCSPLYSQCLKEHLAHLDSQQIFQRVAQNSAQQPIINIIRTLKCSKDFRIKPTSSPGDTFSQAPDLAVSPVCPGSSLRLRSPVPAHSWLWVSVLPCASC